MRRILIVLIIGAVLFLAPSSAAASQDNTNTVGNGEYAITRYKINIEVNQNNTFLITERITVYFSVSKHGIFRKIPLQNEVVRLDGTKSKTKARVSDISVVGDLFTVYNESGYKVIKIGDPGRTQTGYKDYVITYLYDLGKDTGKGYDEFYFNLMGHEWDTTISNIEFTITMPKPFDKSSLGFSSGPKGSVYSGDITYSVSGNVIKGRYNGVLNAGEAITVRLELPDGYFVGAKNNYDTRMLLIMIIAPIIFLTIAFLLWYRFGRDDMVVDTVEFYPPDGYNSAETGFLYKGKAATIDVVSLLIYLANKGYIRITEKKNFTITKLREYNGYNSNEKFFLDGLFRSGNTVTCDDLNNTFYVTLNAIIKSLNSKKSKEQIFEKNSLNKNVFVIIMIITTFLLITIKPMQEFADTDPMIGGMTIEAILIIGVLFPGIGFTIMFSALMGQFSGSLNVDGKPVNSRIAAAVFGVVFGAVFGGIPWGMTVLPALRNEPVYSVPYATGLICVFLMFVLLKYLPKRTAYGNEILGRIRGFKTFLEVAEKKKLEALVMENPTYFYDILPYTYVLGVSDKWIKKFSKIAIQEPDWYDSSGSFSASSFGSFMNSAMASASSAMSSSPSSDSGGGGGSSGGGSSGGGSGGGGGGSW